MPVGPFTQLVLQQTFNASFRQLANNIVGDAAAIKAVVTGGIEQIANAIDAQNQAYFSAAQMALKRQDIKVAIQSLELGLANDPINAPGWSLYSELLIADGHPDLAAETLQKALVWFGLNCPGLPDAITAPLAEHVHSIKVSPGERGFAMPIFFKHGWGWKHTRHVGVATNWLAATFYKPGFLGRKAAALIDVKPLGAGSGYQMTIDDCSNPPGRLIRALTDKYLWVGNSVIDLETHREAKIPFERARQAFAQPAPNVVSDAADGELFNLSITFGTECEDGGTTPYVQAIASAE